MLAGVWEGKMEILGKSKRGQKVRRGQNYANEALCPRMPAEGWPVGGGLPWLALSASSAFRWIIMPQDRRASLCASRDRPAGERMAYII